MRDAIRRLLRQRKAVVGGSILLGFLLLALVGPLLVRDPTELLGQPHQPPSRAHLLGTTGQGQDVLAQTVVGARETLAIGFTVGALVTLVGALVGVTAGYLGRRVDDALTLTTNVFLVIPGLPLAIVLGAYLPSGPLRMVVVLTFAGWAWNARIFRSEALSLRGRDFVAAAVVAGESHARIITRELLPNMASLVASSFIGNTLYAVGAQVGLEFLGLGDVGAVTWGTNLYWAGNDAALLTRSWWIFVPTGLCIALVGFSLTLLSSAIDELTNPALRQPPRAPEVRGEATRVTPAPEPGALLSVRELSVEFMTEGGPTRAVDQVSLDIAPGEILGLAGESGSGKSTLGSALLRLLPPAASITQGRVFFEGVDVTALSPEALRAFRWSRVSMVFQSAMSALNPVLPLGEQFHDTLAAHDRTASKAMSYARARELLAMVGLKPELVDAWPHQLSGGMRQRVGIALALALEPRLIIMDEPTTALDVVVQMELLQRVVELKERLGFAILFITHDLPLLLALADRVGILQAGKLVEVDTARRLRTEARHPYTRLLLSSFPHLGAGDASPPPVDVLEQAPPAHPSGLVALPGGRR